MVDHINDATAGEFGSFSIFEMDNIKAKQPPKTSRQLNTLKAEETPIAISHHHMGSPNKIEELSKMFEEADYFVKNPEKTLRQI